MSRKYVAICLLLTLFATLLSYTSLGSAQQVPSKKTYGYVIVSPNPVGVNQDVLLIFGLTDYLYQWPEGFEGITITVERPDGKTDRLGPFKTDSTGATGTTYKPTMVGTYYFQLSFPGQTYTWTGTPGFDPTFRAGMTVYFQPCTSEKFPLTVQEQPLPTHPGFPLPTEYWSRPIDSQIREWTQVAGNWLDTPINMYAPYNQGPETPHILWASPQIKGAISALGGGLAGGFSYYTSGIDGERFEMGDAYEGLFGTPLVIGGVLYFNRYKSGGGTLVEQDVVAIDIHTGEEIWVRNWNRTRLAFGQTLYWDSFNYHGVFAYLIATRTVAGVTYWDFYEASTGRRAFSYSNVPSGTRLYGPKGEILLYSINVARGWMIKWNSTRVVWQTKRNAYGPTNQALGSWVREYMGATFDARLGIEWNVTIPRGLTEAVPPAAGPATVYLEDRIIGTNFSRAVLAPRVLHVWAVSTAPDTKGRLLFNITWPNPRPDARWHLEAASVKDGVFVLVCLETTEKWGFDINTGRLLWGPTEKQNYKDAWSYSSGYFWDFIYDGKYYSGGCGGTIWVYDVKTGKPLWKYDFKDRYHEWTFGNNWFIYFAFVADGKLYFYNGEHSPNNPLARGSLMACLNASTGEEIWKLNFFGTCWGGKPVIGDSIIVALNLYDMRLYAIGKGPTAVTVEAPSTGIPAGSSIVIRGTVMDISAGTKDTNIVLRFPNGVPAVADECMGDWMLYVYKQFPKPAHNANMKGVWVKLDAVNCYTGEYIDIGGTHTDPYTGMFTVAWQPPKEGLWWIIASFPGSKSYWPSYAQTSIAVTPAPPPEPAPASPEQVQTVQSLVEALGPQITTVLMTLAILVAIAIIVGVYSIIDHRRLLKSLRT
ncbi:MAG: PQQ-binding-like beta-propeller repeat protein [Candidatus Bathyarchaeota archaeon]|nr:PQQ-binding-like beta-propeller repeat protein [Candidatus Bathyarchaeota archaeon]